MRTVQERNIALFIILSLVTCGIYGLYWFVCLTEDTNAAANEEGTSGVLALVLHHSHLRNLWPLLGI